MSYTSFDMHVYLCNFFYIVPSFFSTCDSNPIFFKCPGVDTDKAITSPTASWNPEIFQYLNIKLYILSNNSYVQWMYLLYDWNIIKITVLMTIIRMYILVYTSL